MHEAAGSESPQSFEQAMPCPKSYVVRTIQNHKPLSGSYNLQTKTSLCCGLTVPTSCRSIGNTRCRGCLTFAVHFDFRTFRTFRPAIIICGWLGRRFEGRRLRLFLQLHGLVLGVPSLLPCLQGCNLPVNCLSTRATGEAKEVRWSKWNGCNREMFQQRRDVLVLAGQGQKHRGFFSFPFLPHFLHIFNLTCAVKHWKKYTYDTHWDSLPSELMGTIQVELWLW